MATKKKSGKPEKDTAKFARRAVALYAQGLTVSAIAQRLGYKAGHGQNRTANALIKAGVYKGTRKGMKKAA